MANTYKLIWSDEALENLKDIIAYLEENWTEKEINKFAQLLEYQLNLITKQPFLFPESTKAQGFRKSVLSKQTTIFDNRQDLDKLKEYR